MAIDSIHVGDVGTELLISLTENGVAKDISDMTTREFFLKPPENGTLKTVTASFKTDGTNGQLTYNLVSGNIDVAGRWEVEAHIAKTGADYASEIGFFNAIARLS